MEVKPQYQDEAGKEQRMAVPMTFADFAATEVRFSNDHTNHPTTLNRVDMSGINGSGDYQVVAAGDGWFDRIVDTNNTFCPREPDPGDPDPCAGYSGPSGSCCPARCGNGALRWPRSSRPVV